MSDFEIWLTNDAGRRIYLIDKFAYASFSRSTRGYGIIQFGLPLAAHLKFVPFMFQPDMRLDIWRSPTYGWPKRREGSYLLRKFRLYEKEGTGTMIEFYGRSPIDILRRWHVISSTEADYKKTDEIDDMMKAIVTREFVTTPNVVPAGEFLVEGNVSLGPSITRSFLGKNVLDILTDLKATSFSMNLADSTNKRIFFDVVEGEGIDGGFGYVFRTYAGLRGIDRTSSLVFSLENGNLKDPEYWEDYLDQITIAQVNATQVSSWDINLSRFNHILKYKSNFSKDTADDTANAYAMLSDGGKDVTFNGFFISTPGSETQPRSLYGIDWDLGDLLPVQYAGKNISAEVEIVWMSVDETGNENIVGANKVGATGSESLL